ncbi:conserved hypothetical protein [Bradyrhizobium sp. STM 3843]|uniref:hypothetical protein n=1 Tax=Bradyrhizobium sp. STM 3843 TaxID=551947 RepID=UPI000240A924|nr:hypothetical protein [Bradyrhizobium sp. STM 3843]CCE06104.1 conserved hypothetical protein [Bradyrhizobium sp. STM 3843]
MQSTQNVNEVDPGEIGLSPEKDSYTDIYKRVVRDVLSRIDQRLADIAAQPAPRGAELAGGDKGTPQTRLRRSFRRRTLHGAIGILVVAGLIGGAAAWFYPDATTSMVARWTPSLLKFSATNDADASTDVSSANVRSSAAGTQSSDMTTASLNASSASLSQPSIDRGDNNTASVDRDMMPLIQKLARDVADLQVGIEQLKAGQEQVVRDQARATEQLQAGQDQLMRVMTRISTLQQPKPATPLPQRTDAARPPGVVPPPRPRNANATAQTLFPR